MSVCRMDALGTRLLGGLVLAAALAAPAAAQIPTVETDGRLSEPAAPPPAAPAPPPSPIVIQVPGGQGQGQGEGEGAPAPTSGDKTGYYHTDEYGGPVPGDAGQMPAGAVPDVHVVRSGDTLWDLCWAYYNNPWEWPRIWSYNPEITNPHWIYPGDEVRLRQAGSASSSTRRTADRGGRARSSDHPLGLRQIAFIADEDLAFHLAIDGSPDEKELLATGDEVYLKYPKDRPPRVGRRYAIYLERERVRHPTRDEDVGAFVRVIGEVDVISAAPGKRARGILVDTVDAIERGMAVGQIMQPAKQVTFARAATDLEALIIAEVKAEDLIGDQQVVLLDRGSADRVQVGNHLAVIRRGDAHEPVMSPPSGIGQNDRRFPARQIGDLVVVQTGRHMAIAVVIHSAKELGIGDRARLSRSRTQP